MGKRHVVPLTRLPTFDGDGFVHVVVETPRGSRTKCAYQEEGGYFLRKFTLPDGMSFPYDFGCIPSTRANDGDPLDILVLGDVPLPMGCIAKARVIGGIKATETEKGK